MIWGIIVILILIVIYAIWKLLSLPEKRLERRIQGTMRLEDIPRFDPPESDVITIGEAHLRYGVAHTTLRRWLREKKVAGYKKGRMWLVDVESLEKHLEARKQ